MCRARPDAETERSLVGTLRASDDTPPLVDALPGRWLVWRGGGPLGPRRYACATHRGELTAYLRLHYAAVNGCVWQRPPYPQVWPDGARRPPAQVRPAEGERRRSPDDVAGQAGCVAHALRHDLNLRPGDPRDGEGLLLDRVLERRTGHPLVIAVIAV